ncbi:hypothetical protein K525DRAFT_211665, partial [Schizophyllum commune Loenen D]
MNAYDALKAGSAAQHAQRTVVGLENLPQRRHHDPAKFTIPSKLRVSPDTRQAIESYRDVLGLDQHTYNESVDSQDAAWDLFTALNLYIPSSQGRKDRDDARHATNKYSVIDTKSNKLGGGFSHYTRITRDFQCQSGKDHSHVGEKAGKRKEGGRQMAWPDVGCTSWVRLTTLHDGRQGGAVVMIYLIGGILDHTDECNDIQELPRTPRLPLETGLRNYALSLLRENTPPSLIRIKVQQRAIELFGNDIGTTQHRYHLTANEFTSLRRSVNQERGIPQRCSVTDNLDAWFGTGNPRPPCAALSDALVYYKPRFEHEKYGRFEIILSTPEQRAAAVNLAHKQQLFMDLTFGVCSSRFLVLILLARTPDGKGLPIATMLFTALPDAKAVHASYDTAIITKLLTKFRDVIGITADNSVFTPAVVMTDNDAREQKALTTVWPNVHLMVCIFHIWQAWRNKLTLALASVPKGPDRQEIRGEIAQLLMRLIREINTHDAAISAVQVLRARFEALSRRRPLLKKKQGQAGLSFIIYLETSYMVEPVWKTWSPAAATDAARIMNIPIGKVARTNNPLETFNGRLKNTYIRPYTTSGRLPRADIWIQIYITKVVPDLFEAIRRQGVLNDYRAQLRQVSGNQPAAHVAP